MFENFHNKTEKKSPYTIKLNGAGTRRSAKSSGRRWYLGKILNQSYNFDGQKVGKGGEQSAKEIACKGK